MQNLGKAFRDANLETAQHEIFPTVQNETSQFHLFRIMEFWNRQMAEDTPTNLICSQVVLTLLQCAARLYKDKLHAHAAMDLIESRDTRAVINLAIQDFLFWFVHQQCMKRIKSEEGNVENYFRGAELSSVIRKNKARRLNCQAKIFEHISSLCHSHAAALQNGFEIPRTDEEEILHNYVELTRGYSRCEKSWLIALLPELVQNDVEDHQGQDPRGERPLKEIHLDTSSSTSPQASTPILQEGNLKSLESVENLYWSLNQGSEEPYTPIIKEVLRTSLNNIASKEQNKIADDSDIDYLDLNLESLPRKSSKSNTGIYSRRRAATSSLKMRASEQKSKPIDIRIERIKHHHEDPELEIPRDSGWEPLRSDDSNQSIFSFSPDARERKPLLHEEEGNQSLNMPSTRDDQLTRSLEVSRRSSQLLEPSEWMRTYKGERNLYTIYEELHGEII